MTPLTLSPRDVRRARGRRRDRRDRDRTRPRRHPDRSRRLPSLRCLPPGSCSTSGSTRPARTIARTPSGEVVATMTDGARTVALLGPERTFADPDFTAATVTTTDLGPAHAAGMDLRQPSGNPGSSPGSTTALGDTSPDLFALAQQYLRGQPADTDAGRRDLPRRRRLRTRSRRRCQHAQENSDFYDYLGVPWTFADGKHETPDPRATATSTAPASCGSCSDTAWATRSATPTSPARAPRRAYAIAAVGPGTVVIPDRGATARDYTALQPGDLVFFNLDAAPADRPRRDLPRARRHRAPPIPLQPGQGRRAHTRRPRRHLAARRRRATTPADSAPPAGSEQADGDSCRSPAVAC